MKNKRQGCGTRLTRPVPPRSGLVQPVSILTSDIGFTEIMENKFTPAINKLSTILARRYNQYRWSV